MNEPITTWTVAIDADTTALQKGLADTQKLGSQFGSALGTAFAGLVVQGKSLGDVVGNLALSLSKLTLNAAFKPVDQAIGNALAGLFTGGLGLGGAGAAGAMPVPFAEGGVIASPISFPLAGGQTGIAGERGAEAIMPLSRGPNGELGVAMQGGAAPNITFNISTPDAASFARSQSEIAAMLARTAARGQRNL